MAPKSTGTVHSLMEIMKQEITLLEEFRAKEEILQETLKTSNWENLSELIEEMNRLADWIDSTEKKRNDLYAVFCGRNSTGEEIPFYQAISSLEEDLRSECAELYRSLKFATVKIRGLTWSLDSHIRSVSETMQAVLNELFPYRKGKLYSRRGTEKTADTEPLVVNQHL